MFRPLTCLFMATAVAAAQAPSDLFEKAPPEIDRALRERAARFYQAHVDGQFRKAEALIVEDSKDFFYNAQKQRLISFEITHIKYKDEFTKAEVVTMAEMILRFPGFPMTPMKAPLTSLWRVENGEWHWYIDHEQRRRGFESVFGGGGAQAQQQASPPPAAEIGKAPAVPLPNPADLSSLMNQVKATPTRITLKPGDTAQVTISNRMPGSIWLAAEPAAGLALELDRAELGASQQATLTVRAKPEFSKPAAARITVKPTGQVIHIDVGRE